MAIIGTTTAFVLVDAGCRQSPRGHVNVRERKLTLRARSGLIPGNTITMSAAPSNASCTTHRGDKDEHQGTELYESYDREVQRRILNNDVPKVLYPRGSGRQLFLGFNENYQKGSEIYNIVEREKF